MGRDVADNYVTVFYSALTTKCFWVRFKLDQTEIILLGHHLNYLRVRFCFHKMF